MLSNVTICILENFSCCKVGQPDEKLFESAFCSDLGL